MLQEYRRLIWHILHEAGWKLGVLDQEEVIRFLKVGKRAPTLNSFKLERNSTIFRRQRASLPRPIVARVRMLCTTLLS